MNQSPSPIVARLNDDWARCATLAPDWPCRFGSTLAEVRAALSANDPDAVLTELITAAQAGSALAGRTVVQAFLGSLVRRCRRDTRVGIDEAVAALWLRLAAYPLDRRPRRIALNLMWDTVKDVLAENRGLGYLPVERLRCDVTGDRVFGVAAELGLATQENLAVAASVYGDGLTSALAAERHKLTAGAVRWRCFDTVRRLRDARSWLSEPVSTHPAVWA
jgi:hypothetical protein